jgi:hypothetical protein
MADGRAHDNADTASHTAANNWRKQPSEPVRNETVMRLRQSLISSRARNVALSLCSFVFATLCHAQTDMLVADFSDDAVLRFDGTTGEFLGTFASHPSLDGVASITYGSDGKLYVLGEFSLNVLRFDGLTGAFIDEFVSASDMGSVGLTDPGIHGVRTGWDSLHPAPHLKPTRRRL